MANEKRLIDADAIPWEEHYVPDPNSDRQWDYKTELCVLKPVIDQMSTVDAVEVVRCKDCKFYNSISGLCGVDRKLGQTLPAIRVKHSDFCSYGERKDND